MCPAHKVGYCLDSIMGLSTYFISLDSKDLIMWSTENIHLLRCDATQCGQQATIFQNSLLSVPSWLVPPTLSSYSVILKMEAADMLAITTHHFISSPHVHNTWEIITGVWQHSWAWVDSFSFSWTRQIEDQPVRCMLLSTSHFKLQIGGGGKDSFPSHILTLDESQTLTQNEVSKCKSMLPKFIMQDFLLWHTCAGIIPPQTSGKSTYYNKPLGETVQPAHHHSQCCCNVALSCFKTLQHLVTIIMSRICCRTGTSLQSLTRLTTGLQPINCHFNGRIARNLEGIMLGGGHVVVVFCMAHSNTTDL